MVAPDGRKLVITAASREALQRTLRSMAAHAQHLKPVTGTAPDDSGLHAAVHDAVVRLRDLLHGHDALDVMAMLKQYLTPPDLAVWSESSSTLEGSWACAEVVALALLGAGLPHRAPDLSVRTASIIPDVVHQAADVVMLSTFAALNKLALQQFIAPDDVGTNHLAWLMRSHETSVRGRQYGQVASQINEGILRHPRAETAWRSTLGYTYDDVLAIRRSLVEICGTAHEEVLSRIESAARANVAPDEETIAALTALFETPSQLGLVSIEQVTEESGLAVDLCRAVLDEFSIRPDGRSALDLVSAFVHGRNPMAGKGIIGTPDRGYLVLPGAIALDEVRRTCEQKIKKTRAWSRYGAHRDRTAETVALDAVGRVVHERGLLHRSLEYRAVPRPGSTVDLSSSSTTAEQADLAEADGLLVLDGVAVCVEVKAGDLRPRSRQGGIHELDGDLRKTVREAARQADRLRSLIVANHGLWRSDGSWLDLTDVQEVYTIVVSLDDLGPVALAVDQLVRSNVLTQVDLPWIVSLHDLIVTADVLDSPEQFLTYLRRRTNRDAALWVTASDELDILMWYVHGGFYFEPDPDRLHSRHPTTVPPTKKERHAYSDQGRTLVGTFTDPLDAWFYWQEGSSGAPAERPSRLMNPLLQAISGHLRDNDAPGWWRAAADLDGYSAQAQDGIAENIETTLAATARDGGFHTFASGGLDDTGNWLLIFASGPATTDSAKHLQLYVTAKKHQLRADRALGVLLDPDKRPRLTIWLPHPAEDDPELDQVVRDMGLRPLVHTPRVVPPHVKRSTKPGGKKKQRRRSR